MSRASEAGFPGRVVIDPGHGGRNPVGRSTPFGVRGPGGLLEKDVVLELGRRVARALGPSATLTRDDDRNLALGARAEIAQRFGAHMFLSLHANAGGPGRRGSEAFVHTRADGRSAAMAQAVLEEMSRLGGVRRGVERADLAVLEPGSLPRGAGACLLEVDYLSDLEGERRLRDGHALDDMAHAIANGLHRYGRTALALDWTDWVTDPGITAAFETAVSTNIAMASPITVPPDHERKLRAYAAANPGDGAKLLAGLARNPRFYQGGWILDVQTGASAMTLDTSVFVRESLSVSTYVHEMVHVAQYGDLGRPAFLEAYFSLALAEIIRRLINRLPLDPMTASPLETEAYDIERRFEAWARANGESL
jgi:N-acetylmuramoyl-L-alanine amidase